jgi:hypothetical protein
MMNVGFKRPKVTPQNPKGNFDFVQTGLKFRRRDFEPVRLVVTMGKAAEGRRSPRR